MVLTISIFRMQAKLIPHLTVVWGRTVLVVHDESLTRIRLFPESISSVWVISDWVLSIGMRSVIPVVGCDSSHTVFVVGNCILSGERTFSVGVFGPGCVLVMMYVCYPEFKTCDAAWYLIA